MSSRTKTTVTTLHNMKQDGEKITTLTAYDASFSQVIDSQKIDVMLVGDSLGMTIQGHETTVPVSVDDIIYHAKAVASRCKYSLLMVDLPFMSYTSPEMALRNTARIMQEGNAHMVKLEGGAPQIETVSQLTHHGVPVCAHLGLQPQSVHKLGGYRVQGRSDNDGQQMLDDALALQNAGADALVLECVPVDLANKITAELNIPTIGIGAGAGCDGQVLVLQDLLGITPRAPKFSKDFMLDSGSIAGAIAAYRDAVKDSSFPAEEHCFL
ncbi:MAG: 3-methyl-2-oxobutanoate hydroxymethyltransferase (EC [uncultured Thiotrichaceae bacterium]|uniref:3-methyl-2-oxobutanoate hydroxymethyltransferase n=1 Tax=uncultured Thiotrichaceae bacterium TaxID=298394 RepID=A0A6S6UC20_9GAMM|nr:MAG: 3-methyl-2-oxobutanoate hydroxymethyltransferase (EC [uncultured Thiotrichaceae bacterium]